MDIRLDFTDIFFQWIISFLIGFVLIFLPFLVAIHRKKIKNSPQKTILITVFILIAILSGTALLFGVGVYVENWNLRARDELKVQQEAFNEEIFQMYKLENIKSLGNYSYEFIISVPSEQTYNVQVAGYGFENDSHTINDNNRMLLDLNKVNFKKGENSLVIRLDASKRVKDYTGIDFILNISPENSTKNLVVTQRTLFRKYPQVVNLREGIIFNSPLLPSGCNIWLYNPPCYKDKSLSVSF